MQSAVVAGRTVRYIEAGDPASANVLVLVHAFPVGTAMFEPQRGAFPGWRLIIPALPGFDGSESAREPSIDGYASGVLGLLDGLRIPRAVFAGVSLGGYLLFGILRQAPDRVAGLVLVDTRSSADTEAARAGRQKLLQTARDSGPVAIAREMLPKLLGPTTHAERREIVSNVESMIHRQSAEGIAAAVEVLMSRPDSTPLLSAIQVPTLVIVGREDTLTPPAEMEEMAGRIRGARFVPIAGAGHLSNIERPDVFNQEVAGWLDSL
jgi:pimeloyl-ACP methyl ester carboxylesterase